MIRLQETRIVSAPIAEAFDYAARFENIEDWDPGVISSKKQADGTPSVGSAYDLVTVFKGRESKMTYTITELDSPHLLVLEGEGGVLSAVDTMEFSEVETGTQIRYTADLTFKGIAKLGTLFIRDDLDQLGRDAVDGLKSALDG